MTSRFLTRTNRVALACVTLATLAVSACDQEPVVGPLVAPEPPDNPEIVSAAWVADVNRLTGEVSITAPTSGYDPSILSDFFGLEAGHPDFSILAGDVVNILAQNPSFSAVGAFDPGLMRTSFEIAIQNQLSVINLITPTFPIPPAGAAGPLVFPFEVVVTTTPGGVTGGNGDGTDVIVELPNQGNIAPSVDFDGAPFNFFNDAACDATSNDCYRFEEFAPVPGGATSAYSVVGFDHEPTVSQFRARMIVAADIENATPNALPTADLTGPATSAIGAAAAFSAAGSSDSDGTIVNYEFLVDGVSAQSGASSAFSYVCPSPAATHSIEVIVTDDRSGTDNATASIDCLAVPALGSATKTAANGSGPIADGGNTAPGSTVTYSLSVTNVGTGAAAGVTLVDVLPAGLTFVSADAGCVESAGTVTCTQGALAEGATASFSIVTTATGAAGTAVSNSGDWTSTDAGAVSATHDLTIQSAPNILGRWVDASGSPITSAATGATVFFQLCTTVADVNAFQANFLGFSPLATNEDSDDLDSSGAGVHPDCVGADDNLDAFFTASGATEPINAQIVSTSGPGTGNQGIFFFEFTTTGAGTLDIDLTGIVFNNPAGAVAPVVDVQSLTIS